MSMTASVERTLTLQREIAERLVLSALRETEAAEAAQASAQRAAFLADASRHLAESLDTNTTRKAVAELTLPTLAEWCIVDLLEDDGEMRRLTCVHRDPQKQATLSRLVEHWLPEAGDRFGVPAVMRNPSPVLISEDLDLALGVSAHDPENLRLLQQLGIGSLLTVPLIGETRVIGAITFVSAGRGHVFTDQAIDLAEALAARSALALENARRYAEAVGMKDKAEAAVTRANQFLGSISHEIRTPLNVIAGYVELLERGIHGPITHAQRIDLERISSSQQHLLVLIGELLNFMRIGSGRTAYSAVDVPIRALVASTMELLEPLFAKKEITPRIVIPALPVVAAADPEGVRQILFNLISNAIKFTRRGGVIEITYGMSGQNVILTVSDTGRGIPADMLTVIFEPFVQVQAEDAREHGGVGLGLPISRDLARAMQGDLTVASTLGKGSTFTLTLPASRSREQTHANASPA